MINLLRRAWDTLDTFKQAYPENWHEEDQDVLDDLMKADLDLSGVKREWVGLTDEEIDACWDGPLSAYQRQHIREIEQVLKEKNT